MKPRTSRPQTQLPLLLEPPGPVVPRSMALIRALADLLREALDQDTEVANHKEAIDELEDHV